MKLNIGISKNINLDELIIDKTNLGSLGAAIITYNDQAELTLINESKLQIPTFIFNSKYEKTIKNFHYIQSDFSEKYLSEIIDSANKYEKNQIPDFLNDLLSFSDDNPTSFATPGHHAGKYFNLNPAGYLFKSAYNQTFFSSDTSDVVTSLGDMLTHGGSPLTAEQAAAKLFGADKTYFVTNGTTGSNNIVSSALLQPGDLVLFDRNNHKSLYNGALVLNGATPVYLDTLRTSLGLIGPVNFKNITEDKLREEIKKVAPEKATKKRPFRLAILESETFDGIVPNVKYILNTIGQLCDYILFDSAWGGYESFVKAMSPTDPLHIDLSPKDPGIIVTQSVHKQQAGLAQTSQIHKKDSHIKNQDRYVSHEQFNHAYLKHVTTSYSYPIYTSLVVNIALNSGPRGQYIWKQALNDSINFRKNLLTTNLFKPFNNPKMLEYSNEELINNPNLWKLSKNEKWHGLTSIDPNQAYLDPFKVTITLPNSKENGISGWVLDRYLIDHNIVPEKADPNSILFLVTPGTDNYDWDKLLSVLKQFEDDYYNNVLVSECLSKLYKETGSRYKNVTLQQLCCELSNFFKDNNLITNQKELFTNSNEKPRPLSAYEADSAFVRGDYDTVHLKEALGRIAVQGALPYPPGIFVVVPGEKWTKPSINYFETLFEGIKKFPGFTPEIQGVIIDKSGNPKVHVMKKA
ncbi:Orn/Lys/Arg family decarboxylase [Companilactobacillus sp. DQM5]|uniref:Orn/Lys/Arg family decarboxylase n=1 Tax=Companilactobacillus sp. DQM5 TaxID=3463359 RepID=UPI00405848D9